MNGELTRRTSVLCGIWCLLLAATTVQAASPSLGGIQPWGGQRGTELEVTFSGDRLADAQDLVIYDPGLSVASLEAVDEKSVKVRLATRQTVDWAIMACAFAHRRALAICCCFLSGHCLKLKRLSPTMISTSRNRSRST